MPPGIKWRDIEIKNWRHLSLAGFMIGPLKGGPGEKGALFYGLDTI
jgi:hypothetical protein